MALSWREVEHILRWWVTCDASNGQEPQGGGTRAETVVQLHRCSVGVKVAGDCPVLAVDWAPIWNLVAGWASWQQRLCGLLPRLAGVLRRPFGDQTQTVMLTKQWAKVLTSCGSACGGGCVSCQRRLEEPIPWLVGWLSRKADAPVTAVEQAAILRYVADDWLRNLEDAEQRRLSRQGGKLPGLFERQRDEVVRLLVMVQRTVEYQDGMDRLCYSFEDLVADPTFAVHLAREAS